MFNESGPRLEQNSKARNLDELKERLGRHQGRFRLVRDNPTEGQLTQAEYQLCDPGFDGEADLASTALVSATIYGGLPRERFVESMLDTEDSTPEEIAHMRQRATKTVDNMIDVGLLTDSGGGVELNMDLR